MNQGKPSRRRALLANLALGALAIAAVPAAVGYLKGFLSTDPFNAMFSKTAKDIDSSIGIRMDGVDLRHFHEAKMIAKAHARRVDFKKDRQGVTLYNVTDGYYDGARGKFRYEATAASWNLVSKQVVVSQRVKVQSKDLDLQAKGLVYDDDSGMMRITGDVAGRLFSGQVQASTVSYNMVNGEADAGPVAWSGELSLGPQDETTKSRRWDIKGSHMKSMGGNTDIYLYDQATATDGELIIVAPKVEQNRKTDVLTAKGGVQYYSAKADILADNCVIYRKEKRTILSGHVVMFVKPKSQENDPPKIEKLPEFKPVAPEKVVAKSTDVAGDKDAQKAKEDEIRSSKNFREFPMVVVSDKIEYWYEKGKRRAIITGQPQGRQTLKGDEWRHLWSHEAFYDGEKETLRLVSTDNKKHDTLMKNSLGDVMRATEITVSTKEDDDEMDCVDPDGTINTIDDEIPRDDKKKSDDKKQSPPPPPNGKGKGGGSPNLIVASRLR